jgi:hypothetical protein
MIIVWTRFKNPVYLEMSEQDWKHFLYNGYVYKKKLPSINRSFCDFMLII